MPLDTTGGAVDLDIWHCDPSKQRREGPSDVYVGGCGYVMLRDPAADKALSCPVCNESYPFGATDDVATLTLAE